MTFGTNQYKIDGLYYRVGMYLADWDSEDNLDTKSWFTIDTTSNFLSVASQECKETECSVQTDLHFSPLSEAYCTKMFQNGSDFTA